MIQFAIVIALAPTIALAIFIYQKDRYDREPLYLLAKLFIFGAVSVIPVYFIEKALSSFNIFPGILSAVYTAFIIAGFTEEYFKRLVVLKFAYNDKHYNEKLDGIIYSVFSALGFATVENLLYILYRTNSFIYTGISRGVFAVPAHTLFGVTMGYYLSLSKYAQSDDQKRIFIRKSLHVPIILHGIYDFILISGHDYLMLFFAIFVIYLWKVNLTKLNEYVNESKLNSENNY